MRPLYSPSFMSPSATRCSRLATSRSVAISRSSSSRASTVGASLASPLRPVRLSDGSEKVPAPSSSKLSLEPLIPVSVRLPMASALTSLAPRLWISMRPG